MTIVDDILWIAQTVLSLLFGASGLTKLITSTDKLKARIGEWVGDFSPTQIKMIGIVEVLASAGIVAPMLLMVLPVLTPLAAAGLVLLMIGAIMVHAERSEKKAVRTNMLLIFLALFVFVGRLWIVPVV